MLQQALDEANNVVAAIELVVPELATLATTIEQHGGQQERVVVEASAKFAGQRREFQKMFNDFQEQLRTLKGVAEKLRTDAQQLLQDLQSEFTRLGDEQKSLAAAAFKREVEQATLDAVETMRELPASLTTELHAAAEELRGVMARATGELGDEASKAWERASKLIDQAHRAQVERSNASAHQIDSLIQKFDQHVRNTSEQWNVRVEEVENHMISAVNELSGVLDTKVSKLSKPWAKHSKWWLEQNDERFQAAKQELDDLVTNLQKMIREALNDTLESERAERIGLNEQLAILRARMEETRLYEAASLQEAKDVRRVVDETRGFVERTLSDAGQMNNDVKTQLEVFATRMERLEDTSTRFRDGQSHRLDGIDAQLLELRIALGLQPETPSTVLVVRKPRWLSRLIG